jgi:hypothetical protein
MSLSHLRPLSFGEILDGAFVLYRRHLGTMFVATLVPFLPPVLFWLLVGAMIGGTSDLEGLSTAANLLLMPYSLLATVVVWGALMHLASRAYLGGEVSLGEGFRTALRRFLPLLVSGVVVYVLFVLGLVLFVVPGVIAGIVFFAAWQAVVIEGKGPFAAMSRSRQLARGAWKRIFGVTLVALVIAFMPTMLGTAAVIGFYGMEAFSGPALEVAATVGWPFVAMNVLGTVLSALTYPYFATVMTLLYYDRRVRTEALDLEMATERLGATV